MYRMGDSYLSKVILVYAALVKGEGDSKNVSVGDGEIIDGGVCRERDGHAALVARVARMSDLSTLLR
jgi:hypothetical protein